MRSYLCFTAMAAFALAGCNHSPEGGAPGTNNTFTIEAPTMSTTIKQDNKESIKLTLKRGSDFKKSVSLAATGMEKVKVDFSKNSVAPSDQGDVMMNVTVAKDAPVGDQVIHVTGTPEGGTATSVDVKIKIEKNP